jgi:hypothetical protein
MSLELDEKADLAAGRRVTLGGRGLSGLELVVLPLTLRQNIALARHMPKLMRMHEEKAFDAETIDAVVDVVCIGLRRAHPNISADDLLDLEVTIDDLIAAARVVIEQAGGKKVEAAEGESSAASALTR